MKTVALILVKTVALILRRRLKQVDWIREIQRRRLGSIFLAPIEKRIPVTSKKLDVFVTSYGGVGTSALLQFIHNNHYSTNHFLDKDNCKHSINAFINLKPSGRVIYLFGNPITSVISFLKRNIQVQHSLSMQSNFKRFPRPVIRNNIEKFATAGKDRFMLEEHFDTWSKLNLKQPILFVRYETLWENLTPLFDFLDLPTGVRNDFPLYQERESKAEDLPPDTYAKLNRIYGSLTKKISVLPDYFVHSFSQKSSWKY